MSDMQTAEQLDGRGLQEVRMITDASADAEPIGRGRADQGTGQFGCPTAETAV